MLLLIYFTIINQTINAGILFPLPPLIVFLRRGNTDYNPGDIRVMIDPDVGNESFPFFFVDFVNQIHPLIRSGICYLSTIYVFS